MKTTLIYPATDKHIAKYSAQEMFVIEETPEDYEKVTLPYIELSHFSIEVYFMNFYFCQGCYKILK